MSANKFVFVVCGKREHIDTLHFALHNLKHFSKNEILVVTDSLRNEIPVVHTRVIDVKTPGHFTHHQASIYLKTGVHQFVPKGFTYCYIDTDVVALSNEVDSIFDYKKGVVTFAADQFTMPEFSPYAVNCGCAEAHPKMIAELESLIVRYDPARLPADEMARWENKKAETLAKFESIKKNRLYDWLIKLRFNLASKRFALDSDTVYDKLKSAWVDGKGRKIFSLDSMEEGVMKNSPYRWNEEKHVWTKPNGCDVYTLECDHLAQYIHRKWGIEVKDHNFRHWNGGVFLFDDSSSAFMNEWFNKSVEIFGLPEWKTRDQGTLIATVWQFNLQSSPLLPSKFNFITDCTNMVVNVDEEGNFTRAVDPGKIKPAFVHLIHSIGRTGWPVWEYVKSVSPGGL